jgi:hypothetical protein
MPETAARDYPQEIAYTGGWHIEPTATDETVRFGLSYPASASNRTTSTALASLGLTAQSLAGEAHPIDFRDARDAGTFECRGMAEAGRASGEFRFRPDPAYAELVRESGFPPLTLREHIQAGMFEIGSPFLKAIGASGIENVAFSDLVKMSVFKIKPEAIRELHAYFPSEGIDELTRLATVGVTAAYADALCRADIRHRSAENVAALRASGVDQAFVDRLAADGRHGLSIDDVVSAYRSGS